MKKIIYFAVILTILFFCNFKQVNNKIKHQDFVPDKQTAVKVAEVILIPIFGEQVLDNERPFNAVLNDGVWTVSGTLPTGAIGGVVSIEIRKYDCKIFEVSMAK